MEEKKEYLKGYRRAKEEAEAITCSIQELKRDMELPAIENERSGKVQREQDKSRLKKLEQRLEDKKWEALNLHVEIEGSVMDMDAEAERSLLRYRYIAGMKWEDICDKMGYSWRQIHYLHNKALEHFQKTA